MAEWMTVKEAAAYLKVSRATIFNWCRAGRLPYYNVAGENSLRRFKREDLDAFMVRGEP